MSLRRPTRRDLIVVLTRLQGHVSQSAALAMDENLDPKPLRQELKKAFDLCVDALEQDLPASPTAGPWGSQ